MAKVSIIIPVFNEARTVRTMIEKVRNVNFGGFEREIVVIDDGSSDRTAEILDGLGDPSVRVLRHRENQGKGMAVRTGLAAASGDYFAIQDADLEYDPGDYAELLDTLVAGDLDIVFGTRFGGRNQWRPINRLQHLAHAVINAASNRLSGVALSDPTCCHRVFNRRLRDHLLPRLCSRRFTLEVEMVARVGRGRFRYRELPIHYQPRTYSEGKKIRWSDGLKILWAIVRYNLA
jgi:glycosyltransferase involved in cell wall biosynthesis